MKRIIALLVSVAMFIGQMPATALTVEPPAAELEGKKISILGASISTYTGISNNAGDNATIGDNAVYYTAGRHGVYAEDTWWMQAVNDLGLELLVNNSWSGSSLLYERNGTAGAYVDRCVQLHNQEGEEPDIIAIQMGTNDFQYYKETLGNADIDYDTLIAHNEDGSYTYAIPATSLEAAAIVLHKISVRYPKAEVYYLNISQRVDGTDALIQSFNAELKQVVEHFGAHIVDIYGSAITMENFDTYIGDGRVHPNKLGMDAYTEAFKRSVIANTDYSIDTHKVTLNLDGVTADYGDHKIVKSGDTFGVKLMATDRLSVIVTMGGADITDEVYTNGAVHIAAVTNDVTITATTKVKPQKWRWEFDGADLSCTVGNNTLTKHSGTTADGVFANTRYALAWEVVLKHDLPWTVEWKCEGTFQNSGGSSGARIFTSDNVNANYNARYIFKSNKNGLIAMGEKTSTGSHNYGIALGDYGIDWTALHTYRLENRIAADGSNMVWLYVDGEEIGPMNHYYIGTTDKATTSDWLSGKDFVFPYMGTDTHGFTNASIEYIQVTECDHVYENGICTVCGEKKPTEITLGDFAVAGVGKTALSKSDVLLSQKTLIAVPYCGATLHISVSDGYRVKVHSGNNYNNINQVSDWLSDGETYTLPLASIYMRVSIQRADGGKITLDELETADVVVSYESDSDICEDNADVAQILTNTELPVLIHLSDIHGDTIRAERAASFADFVGADALLASGDLTAYEPDDWGNALFDSIDNYPNVNFIYGIGNHDTRIAASAYYESIYNSYFKGNPDTSGGETYYYRDLADQKLRIVAVNQQEGASTTTSGGTCYSQAQVDWLVETLKTTPAGYGVVFMYHSPETTIAAAEDPDYSEFFQVGNRYDNPTNSYSGYSGTFLMDLVDAFMLRENFTQNYSEKDGTSPVTLNADFTNVAEGVEFIAHVTGHVHSDSITYLPGTACKQLLLGVTCTNSMYGEPGGYYGLADYSDLNRVGNTSAQDAFNAYIIDRENKTVRVLRVGARQTVSGDIRDDMTIPYSVPFENGEYLFDTEGLIKLDLSNVEWVNYGFQAYGVEPTYYPGQRWSTDMIFDVPYDGVTFYIKINAPYELGIRSGKTDTTMSTNYYWLNNKELISGDKNRGYVYAIPVGHEKFILSIANVTRDGSNNVTNTNHPISFLELQAAGVEIWYRPEPTEEPIYPFSTEDKVKLDLNSVEWVNYGYQPYGPEPTYHVGTRLTTNMIFDVPYEGVTFYIKINAPYELGIRSGETGTAMDTNLGWLNNKYLPSGNSNYGFAYAIPAGHHKFILTIGNVTRNSSNNVSNDRNPITLEELEAAGLEIWYVPCTHTYKNGVCTACGIEHPNLANYEGKVISILGDSISTFAGYIPVADGFNLEHLPRYPQADLLTDVEETWWMQVIAELDAKLGINDSWRGATCSGAHPVTTGTTGANAAMANLQRIANLGANGTPDIILFYGGTNDLAHVSKVGTFDPQTAPTQVDLTTKQWGNLADGYVHTLLRLKHFYPDATIVAMLPTYTASYYSNDKLAAGNEVLAQICQHYGVVCVDLRDCGISTKDLPDGIHPNAAGMDYITGAVLDALLNQCEMKAGENIVHSVKHELSNVKSSLGYFKGVSDGMPFEATLTGEEMQVRVEMDGVDVTEQVYRDGVIRIESVTGDLRIVASGRVKPVYEGHLQELGKNVCADTNLWALLDHDEQYYAESGWMVHSSGKVYSVTIPVSSGDRIWATSIQGSGANGGTIRGIRVTWFLKDGTVMSMNPDKVYQQWQEDGYLTAPEGAVAVCIPMWNVSDSNALYLLGRDHVYENGFCAGCGAVLGDLDADGDVDAEDLTILARHVAGIEVLTDPTALQNADVSGDGTIDAEDLTIHARFVAGIIPEWNSD